MRRQHFLKRDAVFFVVLVYSDDVHLDPRVHAAITAISHIGGQHGQESEEGEEGEERSEEDCEEDPQGREEEEVTSPLEVCRRLSLPARHLSFSDLLHAV